MAEESYSLRPYQQECKKIIEQNPEGHHLIALATGLGKTVIFTHLETEGRTLILSHRDELVRQPEKFYAGRKSFGVEKAEEHADGEDVVSASVQTLSQDSRLSMYEADAFQTIIVDEAHHAAAKSYRKVLDHFSGAKLVLGFTATPNRGDGVRLTDVFEDILFNRDLRWGIENGYLSRIRCVEVKTDMNLRGITRTAGDYNQAQLERALGNSSALPVAAKTYVQECHEAGRHTLVYCVTKKFCVVLQKTIRRLLPEAEAEKIQILTGDTPDAERKEILQGFMDGTIPCIINCMVLTEGTDLPICDTVINIRPTCNSSLYQQIVGRATRIYEGKEYCLVYDIVPENKDNTRQLCTAPSLFGIDISKLDQRTSERLNKDEDLLAFCDSLSEKYANEARKLEIRKNIIELFMADREDLIEKNAGKGMKSLATDYMQYIDSRRDAEDEYDFGCLDVEVQADETRYYKIKPTWNETIYMSKPDILGNTVVEFQCPSVPGWRTPSDRVSGEMKMEDAIHLVQQYCESQSEHYRYSWDRDLQKQWMNMRATNNQMYALQSKYRGTGLNISDFRSLTKLEASKLIDMAVELQSARKEKKTLELAVSGKKSQAAIAAKEEWDNRLKKEKSAEKQKSNIIDFAKAVHRRHASVLAEREAVRQEEEAVRSNLCQRDMYGTFIGITTTLYCGPGCAPSDKQLKFANSLLEKLSSRGICMYSVEPMRMSRRQISALLDLMVACDRANLSGPATFINALQETIRVENAASAYVDCRYYFTVG